MGGVCMVLRDEAELVPGLMGSMVLGGAGWYWGELHIVQSRQSISSDVSPAASPHFQITTHSSALVGLGIMGGGYEGKGGEYM